MKAATTLLNRICFFGLALAATSFVPLSLAEAAGPAALSGAAIPATSEAKHGELGISEWLLRMHEASRRSAYIGTFVVSAGANMSSARIWQVCDGDQIGRAHV